MKHLRRFNEQTQFTNVGTDETGVVVGNCTICNSNGVDIHKHTCDLDKERAKRNQISNFPHSAKEDAKKREEREKRSRKEDPDGMYPRDDRRYDDTSSKSGWQDGMGKPSWLD